METENAVKAVEELVASLNELTKQHNAVIRAVQLGDATQVGEAIVRYVERSTAMHTKTTGAVLAVLKVAV